MSINPLTAIIPSLLMRVHKNTRTRGLIARGHFSEPDIHNMAAENPKRFGSELN